MTKLDDAMRQPLFALVVERAREAIEQCRGYEDRWTSHSFDADPSVDRPAMTVSYDAEVGEVSITMAVPTADGGELLFQTRIEPGFLGLLPFILIPPEDDEEAS